MDEPTQPLNPTWPDPNALVDFIDELREAGYNIGVAHYGAAQDLLLALISQGELGAPQRLKRLLGPLFCSSSSEQEDFPHRFDRWLERQPFATGQVGPQTKPSALIERELKEIEQQAVWWRWLLIGVVILTAFTGVCSIISPGTQTCRQAHPPL